MAIDTKSKPLNRPLRSRFLPLLLKGNPYMGNLVSSLESNGVTISGQHHFETLFLKNLLKERADILHLHWLWGITAGVSRRKAWVKLKVFLTQLRLAQMAGVRIVFTVHNLKPHESPFPEIDLQCTKRVLEIADRSIVHGDSAKGILKEELNLTDTTIDKIDTVLHGHFDGSYLNEVSREDARERLGLAPDDFVFLNLGTIRPYKGVINLIQVFKEIEDPKVKLILAGRPLNDDFEREIKDGIGTDSRVLFFPGFVPDEDVQVYINACDAMVFPFREVLTSGSVLLGLSFGRTCVAPKAGCIRDILDDDEAFLYTEDAHDGLIEAMNRAIESREETLSRGTRVREKALGWDWEMVGRETYDVYLRALGENNGG